MAIVVLREQPAHSGRFDRATPPHVGIGRVEGAVGEPAKQRAGGGHELAIAALPVRMQPGGNGFRGPGRFGRRGRGGGFAGDPAQCPGGRGGAGLEPADRRRGDREAEQPGPIGSAGGDSNHILEGAPEFDAQNVGAGINPKGRTMKQLLDHFRRGLIPASVS